MRVTIIFSILLIFVITHTLTKKTLNCFYTSDGQRALTLTKTIFSSKWCLTEYKQECDEQTDENQIRIYPKTAKINFSDFNDIIEIDRTTGRGRFSSLYPDEFIRQIICQLPKDRKF